MALRVCHMSSCHQPKDTRIFLKECLSLAEAGHEVYLVVQGNDEDDRGVHIKGCGMCPPSRKKRMTSFARSVYERAHALDCDVYHFHDPELLPYGLKLKRRGKKVIFDSHEDVPAQIMDKHWIPSPIRFAVSRMYRRYETYAVRRLDAVVAATPHIGEQFEGRARRVVVVNNYPRLDDIEFHDRPFEDRDPVVCYAGGISELRGEKVMVEAMKDVEGTLVLAGKRSGKEAVGGVNNVVYLGQIDRAGVNGLYGGAVCGLVVLQPTRAYVDSLPVKMFEYMAAGLPFICSSFPLWASIVEETGAGICVRPDDEAQIASAISRLLGNRREAQAMGLHGRKAIERKYNWGAEGEKLLYLYEKL